MPRLRRGYTLFELMIVLALILVLAGLAVPSIESMYSDSRLQAAVDQVSGKWSAIRLRAITEGRPYRFSNLPGSGAFRVAPDSSDYWGGGDPPVSADSDNAPLVVQDTLPRGIRFGTADSADSGPATDDAPEPSAGANTGSWNTVAVFLPDGTARQDVEILFRSREASPVSLRLRALTGGVSSRRLRADGSVR